MFWTQCHPDVTGTPAPKTIMQGVYAGLSSIKNVESIA